MPTYTVEIVDDEEMDELSEVVWTVQVVVPEDGPLKPSEEWAKNWALETFRQIHHARMAETDDGPIDQRYELKKVGEHEWQWVYG